MKTVRRLAASLTMLAAVTTMAGTAHAQTYSFSFSGPGTGGTIVLTYGAATDATYHDAREVTGISGTFFDTNNGLNIVDASIGSLVSVTHATPEPGNLRAPNDFSRFAVASGLPAQSGGFVTYDNLFWPGGSPPTATDYTAHGGFLDIYGLLFEIGGGRVVNLWSNGADDTGAVDYGASVTTSNIALDYVVGGVTTAVTTPEPSALWLVGVGVVGVLTWRRRTAGAA